VTPIFLWLWLAIAGAVPSVQVPEELTFEEEVRPEVDGALADLRERRFEEAARRFGALADAGGNADLRYLEAMARYEAGDLRRAVRAAERGVATDPEHGPLLNLYGLALSEVGRGEEALVALERADAKARRANSVPLEARVALNEGLVWMDQGELGRAESASRKAARLAEQAGETGVLEQAAVNLSVVASLRGTASADDLVGKVADRLRRGDLDGARALVPSGEGGGRREVIELRVARAALARAEGRFDEAATDLQVALVRAREGGMVREVVRVLGELGTVHLFAHRDLLAREYLREALDTVEGTHFKIQALDLRAQAGLVDTRLGLMESARTHLLAGRDLARRVDHPIGVARLDELQAAIAAADGDMEAAAAAYEAALRALDERKYWADSARVASALVVLSAGRDPDAVARWSEEAIERFRRAGDPLGSAHVGIATGLGLAREGEIEGALKAFVGAARVAEESDTERGRQVARVARDNAAEALRVLGHSAQAVQMATELGLVDAVAHHEAFAAAKDAWVEGMAAWDAGEWATARERFDTAFSGFREIGENGYAATARRGRAWALWNLAVGQSPVVALPYYEEIVQEAIQVNDPELRVRARAAQALSAMEIPQVDAEPLLRTAAEDAESIGMDLMASRCWAGLADLGEDMEARARAARRSQVLDPGGSASAYAMYSVAVDAYNADQYALAQELSREVLPHAGDLRDAVTAVLEAAQQAAAAD
jgi:tetratricopeptide (TPR) repeat protein